MPGTEQTKANESNYSKHDILVFHLTVLNKYRSGSTENVVQVNVWEWRESYNEKGSFGMYSNQNLVSLHISPVTGLAWFAGRICFLFRWEISAQLPR